MITRMLAAGTTMRIHHLNCISSCPLGGRLMDGRSGSPFDHASLTCHCLLVETENHLVLVDTGYGLADVEDPRSRLSRFFLALLQPELRREMTAIQQIRRIGFDPIDVRHIVLTHLDFDHAGGLDDFPWAKVHLLDTERAAALRQRSWLDRQRYRPQQWSTHGNWQMHHGAPGESWFGFDEVSPLDAIAPGLVMVPLIGHTFGHSGVAVRSDEGWLLLAGDAYFFHGEMEPRRPWCPPGLRLYQWMMEKDRPARLRNQERLRELALAHPAEVRVICSHDAVEFAAVSGRAAGELPAAASGPRGSRDVRESLVRAEASPPLNTPS
jgi:glyoxylase-like metal-dependent hydrolase (beta-lactamase superfamily II)